MGRGLVAQSHRGSVLQRWVCIQAGILSRCHVGPKQTCLIPGPSSVGGGVRHRAGMPWNGTDPALSPQRELRPRLCTMKRGANGYGFNLHSDKSKPGQFIRSVDPDSPAEASGLQAQDRIVEVTLLAFFPGSSFLTTSSQISRSWGRHHTACSSVSPRGPGSP